MRVGDLKLCGSGGAGSRSRCLSRSMHALDQLRRPQYRALGAVSALEGSKSRLGHRLGPRLVGARALGTWSTWSADGNLCPGTPASAARLPPSRGYGMRLGRQRRYGHHTYATGGRYCPSSSSGVVNGRSLPAERPKDWPCRAVALPYIADVAVPIGWRPIWRRPDASINASKDGLLRLGDDSSCNHRSSRSVHALGQLKRSQYRALGAINALEGSKPRPDRAKMLTLCGAPEGS